MAWVLWAVPTPIQYAKAIGHSGPAQGHCSRLQPDSLCVLCSDIHLNICHSDVFGFYWVAKLNRICTAFFDYECGLSGRGNDAGSLGQIQCHSVVHSKSLYCERYGSIILTIWCAGAKCILNVDYSRLPSTSNILLLETHAAMHYLWRFLLDCTDGALSLFSYTRFSYPQIYECMQGCILAVLCLVYWCVVQVSGFHAYCQCVLVSVLVA